MRVVMLILTFAARAYAQTPADPAPSPPAAPTTAAPAPAPVVAPHFDLVRVGLMQAMCAQEQACGCSNGVPKCMAMLGRAALPAPTLACLGDQPCAVICESDRAGQPGTKLHDACLTPEAAKRAVTRFKETAVLASCATFKRCGCEARPPEVCAKAVIADTPLVSGDFFACVASQPCADVCDAKTHQPGGGIHTRCMVPDHQAATALTQQTIDLMGRLSAEMQAQMHRTTMGLIRNMGGDTVRVRVYDAEGNFIRNE